MNYYPFLFSSNTEIRALRNQSFSTDVVPIINIISENTINNVIDLVTQKPNNKFLVNVPMNLNLNSCNTEVHDFYNNFNSNKFFNLNILKMLSNNANVTPIIDLKISNYSKNKLHFFRKQINKSKVGYIIYIDSFNDNYFNEIQNLISNDDLIILYLNKHKMTENKVLDIINKINVLKNSINFESIVISQIYKDLTFNDVTNGQLLPNSIGYSHIYLDFFRDFKTFGFDNLGDHCGCRYLPMQGGGNGGCFPLFIGLNKDNFSHFFFRGIAKDRKSYANILIPAIKSSNYFNNILPPQHKANCKTCDIINNFLPPTAPTDSHPLNKTGKLKELIICHYISLMDYKLNNNLI